MPCELMVDDLPGSFPTLTRSTKSNRLRIPLTCSLPSHSARAQRKPVRPTAPSGTSSIPSFGLKTPRAAVIRSARARSARHCCSVACASGDEEGTAEERMGRREVRTERYS